MTSLAACTLPDSFGRPGAKQARACMENMPVLSTLPDSSRRNVWYAAPSSPLWGAISARSAASSLCAICRSPSSLAVSLTQATGCRTVQTDGNKSVDARCVSTGQERRACARSNSWKYGPWSRVLRQCNPHSAATCKSGHLQQQTLALDNSISRAASVLLHRTPGSQSKAVAERRHSKHSASFLDQPWCAASLQLLLT